MPEDKTRPNLPVFPQFVIEALSDRESSLQVTDGDNGFVQFKEEVVLTRIEIRIPFLNRRYVARRRAHNLVAEMKQAFRDSWDIKIYDHDHWDLLWDIAKEYEKLFKEHDSLASITLENIPKEKG